MPGTTTFASIKFAQAADEVNKFPAEVSEPGAKTIDKYLEEHTLTFKTRAASYSAVSGEFGVQTSAAKTTTLPAAATASQIIAVFCKTTSAKVTTSGGAFIIGKTPWATLTEASKTATVELTEGMTAFFFSDGTNWELWGEIKAEAGYENKVATKAEAEAGVELSATRPALCNVESHTVGEEPTNGTVTVGGAVAGIYFGKGPLCGLRVEPGQKVAVTTPAGSVNLRFKQL